MVFTVCLDKKLSPENEIQYYLETTTCDPSVYTMYHPYLTTCIYIKLCGKFHWFTKGYMGNSIGLRNSYTMGCPPVRGDNPRALASGLSYVQMEKHAITI